MLLRHCRDLKILYDEISREYVLDIFFTSKAEELAAIFEDSPYEFGGLYSCSVK